MKNNLESGNELFRKKGFFIALYSCLGIVATLAVIVTINSRSPGDSGTSIAYEQEETLPVGADQVDPYLAGLDEDAWFRPRRTEPEPPPQTTPTPAPTRPAPPPVTPPPQTTEPPATDPGVAPEAEPAGETPVSEEPAEEPSAAQPIAQDHAAAPTTFAPFAEGDRMAWPVYGETVMVFSASALIYDPTLDQFRTNDNLRIAANEGDAVRAGAAGRVIAVGRNVRQGNYVTIDHGNGWLATYGQLMESIIVTEGDIVQRGQVIGGVGQPSIFAYENGTHLHLRIERDEVAVDPYDVLVARES